MRKPNYDKFPVIRVPDTANQARSGWDAIVNTLRNPAPLIVDCYPGVDVDQILAHLKHVRPESTILDTRALFKSSEEIDRLIEPFLGGDDPIFGYLSGLNLDAFLDPDALRAARNKISGAQGAIIAGPGAALVGEGTLVYADLPRWEAQLRMRRNEISNLGADNRDEKWTLQYKRAFFIDWRVCDRHKRNWFDRVDYFLDTTTPEPKLAAGAAVRAALRHAVTRPFRVVPFFDPAPWGGQWMKRVCDLDPAPPNYGWCFDCVPEENSLLLEIGGVTLETPSINLVFQHPRELLGEAVFARFGAEFPIRFDFLDTLDGGNLSFQVHPDTDYIQQNFGMHYTQDESYYLLDAGAEACVYLGLKENVDGNAMIADLQAAQRDPAKPFDADKYANRWPAKKHDHFLIPAGTVHCSGKDAMVLEISATPYIFTFKLWDWGRLGLDGKPRPINIKHGSRVIDWRRDTAWTQQHLVNRFEPIAQGPGWREERTGLHELEFIETRRHWFSRPVAHHTHGGVNVLNLVEGESAIVESPDGAFEPYQVHYAETFIVPASVGAYTIRPAGAGAICATLKAFVR